MFQSHIPVSYSYPTVACVERGQAWVKTRNQTIELMDREGSVKDKISIDFPCGDFVATSDGDLLFADFKNNSIKSISKEKHISTLFTVNMTPSSLCCLHNDNIVVAFCMEGKVIVYSRNGEIRENLDQIKFRFPMRVATNKVNQDIYICDHERNGYETSGKVIVVGVDGKFRYEYSGRGDGKFTPVEVCTDLMGHVLITDIGNGRVHILDQDGRFIQYILTSEQGLGQPNAIDVDTEGYVWIGGYVDINNGRLKVAKYLQKRTHLVYS